LVATERRPRVGILALQGDVREHAAALREVGAEPVEVRLPRDLAGVEALILPGGESKLDRHAGAAPLGGLFWGPLAAIGVILAAVYLLWMFQRVMYGPVREAYRALPDLSRLEVACALPLLLLTVLFGVLPQPFIAYIEPSLERVIRLATDPSFMVVAFK